MPKRSNRFQRLVLLLQRQLSGAGAVVSESKMIKDRVDGEEVEIDIAVELMVNDLPLTIGFEVRDTARRIDRNAAIAIVGKYRNLVDKTVIVSRSGFTRSALKHCKMHGVEAITLADAATADWGEFFEAFKSLYFVSFEFSVLGGPTVKYAFEGQPFRPLAEDPVPLVISPNGQRITLADAGAAFLRDSQAAKTIMDTWYATPIAERLSEYQTDMTLTPNPSTPILLDQDGHIYRVESITYKISVKAHGVSFPLSAMQFRNRKVMQGFISIPSGFLSDKEVCMVVSEGPAKDRKASLMFVPKGRSGEPALHEIELQSSTPPSE